MVTTDIKMNAGTIRNLLFDKGRLTLREIAELTKYHESLIQSALKLLSKEGKIDIRDRNSSVYIELRDVSSDIYY